MGKDLKGKELGKGITQRKNGCYVGDLQTDLEIVLNSLAIIYQKLGQI